MTKIFSQNIKKQTKYVQERKVNKMKKLLSIILVISCFLSLTVSVSADEVNEPVELTVIEITTAEQFNSQEKSGYFKLMADIIGAMDFEMVEAELTIDLNGHTLQAAAELGGHFMRPNTNSILTICDSVGGGKIVSHLADGEKGSKACVLIHNNSTFNFYGGEISNWKRVGDGAVGSVIQNCLGNVVIDGGKITNCSGEKNLLYGESGSFIITGNTVIEGNDLSNCALIEVKNETSSIDITINGGIIRDELIIDLKESPSTLTICGGTFSTAPSDTYYDAATYEVAEKDGMFSVIEIGTLEAVVSEPETEPETVAPETEAPVVETQPETTAPVVSEPVVAPQTFDFGVVAAVCAVVSLAGYAVSKKR